VALPGPGNIPSAVSTAFELHVNRAAAGQLGIALPQSLLSEAKVVID